MGGAALEQRVERAAEAALAEKRYVTAIDLFQGLGWLLPPHLDERRQGRVQCLERVVQASLPKLLYRRSSHVIRDAILAYYTS